MNQLITFHFAALIRDRVPATTTFLSLDEWRFGRHGDKKKGAPACRVANRRRGTGRRQGKNSIKDRRTTRSGRQDEKAAYVKNGEVGVAAAQTHPPLGKIGCPTLKVRCIVI